MYKITLLNLNLFFILLYFFLSFNFSFIFSFIYQIFRTNMALGFHFLFIKISQILKIVFKGQI